MNRTHGTETLSLADVLQRPELHTYLYSYPHKHAYRPLAAPVALEDAWAREDTSALFLYVHVPFCESRCGFCNLFAVARPDRDLVARYVAALQREFAVIQDLASGERMRFAQFAVGGGTPSFLSAEQLETVLHEVQVLAGSIPGGVEVAPDSASADRLDVLRAHGVERVSIGVQSFIEDETAAVFRRQTSREVHAALSNIKDRGFPLLNIDLIYGLPGQNLQTWQDSLRTALDYEPGELYLYPLYVRPGTGYGRHGDGKYALRERTEFYRAGRKLLLNAGYRQISLRLFRRADVADSESREYRCQADGMIGLGAGARSYTRALHYSGPYTVGRSSTTEIIRAYVNRKDADLRTIDYGMALNEREQKHRFVILSLLTKDGLSLADYRRRFGNDVRDDFTGPRDLQHLLDAGYAELLTGAEQILRLTPGGLERSDALGAWLISDAVRARMEAFELR